jgi:hypothetical protein
MVVGNDEVGNGGAGHLFLARGLQQTRDGFQTAGAASFLSLSNCPLPDSRMQARNVALRQRG